MSVRQLADVERAAPPPWPHDPLPMIQAELARSGTKVVVLDDDPTGTQTVRDIAVVTAWDEATLAAELANDGPGFFILTNSRSLDAMATAALHRELAANLKRAAGGMPLRVISRGDSTLRGHYPLETDVLSAELGLDGTLYLAPFFAAGGRLTVDDSHYVTEDGALVPVSATPFARDAVFGYRNAELKQWVQEKTDGRIAADAVQSISLTTLRQGGPEAVAQQVQSLPSGAVCVVNAIAIRDIEVFAAGLTLAEQHRAPLIGRTAASVVAALLGQPHADPLPAEQLARPGTQGGLVIVGSHVPKTTAQLNVLLADNQVTPIEINIHELVDGGDDGADADDHVVIERVSAEVDTALRQGADVVVFTSRELIALDSDEANLALSRRVSQVLVAIVASLSVAPRYLIAKGGITSSDIATAGCGVRRANVLGQILPGVPVWELGPETRFPGLPYVVFPGNVGGEDAVAQAVHIMSQQIEFQ